MPKLGLTMKSGTIVEWLKKEGDEVREGEPVAVITTEKMTAQVQAPKSGRIVKILAPVNSEVPVGEPIAIMEAEG